MRRTYRDSINSTQIRSGGKQLRLLSALLLVFIIGLMETSFSVQASEKRKSLDVLFTHDTHSHLNSFITTENGSDVLLGGFSRIRTLIGQQKEKNPDTLVVDGGDFSMGTLIQTMFSKECAELRLLGALEYDMTTLGNHEYDYRSGGLAGALLEARNSGDVLPGIVLSNVDWKTMEEQGLTEEQTMLRDAFEEYGIQDYAVIEKGDVRIALLGIFGGDAPEDAPTCALLFRDAAEAAAETVKKIREKEDVDLIVCLSHSGTTDDPDRSPDELLAKAVPEIDLIISGHTHSTLQEPIIHGDTYLVSCGEYGRNLGSLSMSQKENGRWVLDSYELIPVTEDVPQDAAVQELIDAFMDTVDEGYLADFGWKREETAAENTVLFCTVKELEEYHGDGNLGNLIADAYRYAVGELEDGSQQAVDVTMCPSGTVRETYPQGEITVEDIFNSFSLGIGPDGVPGYPLISVYVTGKELKTAVEIDASISDLKSGARLYFSGLHFTFNPHRLILNRVSDSFLSDHDGNRMEIEDDRLYRVVTDLYSGQMLGAVTGLSYGLLSVVPKDANGQPYENIEDAVLHDANGREIKAWDAIVRYMKSFEDVNGNGIGDVPAVYGQDQGRKVMDTSWNPINLIRNPNRFFFIILAAVLVLAGILILVIRLIIRIRKRRKSKKKTRDTV